MKINKVYFKLMMIVVFSLLMVCFICSPANTLLAASDGLILEDCNEHRYVIFTLIAISFMALIYAVGMAGFKKRAMKIILNIFTFIVSILTIAASILFGFISYINLTCFYCFIFAIVDTVIASILLISSIINVPAKEAKAVQVVKEEEPKETYVVEEETSLKENLSVASMVVTSNNFSKKFVADYLESTYKKEVEVNRRANYTAPGRGKTEGLPLADTHYTLKGTRSCFVYVYELNGKVLLLAKANENYGKGLKTNHKLVTKSAFPKSPSPWYSIPLDNSWNEDSVKQLLDDIKAMNEGKELTLKESLKVAASLNVKSFDKAFVADYLEGKYDNEVEVNRRANYTAPGRGKTEGLPLADTHYTLKGTRSCFVYVYEVNGSVLLLAKANEEYAEGLMNNHKLVKLSAFPKSPSKWYSIPLDGSWNEDSVKQLLDDIKAMNEGKELTLKESLKVAASLDVKSFNKDFIASYLDKKYGNEVELNRRANYTAPGRGKTEGLPLADTHYTLKGTRSCFVYVYEVNGSVLLLAKADEKYGKELMKEHKLVKPSAFPKSPYKWYSIPLDDSWNQEKVEALLDNIKASNEQ